MAQTDNTKANKLAYLHMRIVQNVVRKLLQFIVRQSNQQWTLDEYFEANGDKILQTQLAMRHRSILLPRHSMVTIESLPLYLIEHLITDIPQCFVVPRDISDAIRSLNQIRRESNSAIVTGVDETMFENQLEKMKTLLTTICLFMDNKSDAQIIQRDIEGLRESTFITDETVLDEFKQHYEKEKSHRKAITSFPREKDNLHRMIEKVVSIRDGNVSDAANTIGVDARDHGTDQRNEPFPLEVQVTDVVIEMDPGTARMSRDIVNVINNQEDSDGPNPLRERGEEIISTFTKTFSYYGDFFARQGCVQICVKPRSIKLLFELFEDCVRGEITQKLQTVEESIRCIHGFENYKPEAVLYQDHYDSVMNDLASQIRQQFEDRGLTLENESAVPKVELSANSTILIRVPCPSEDDRDQFVNTFKSGKTTDLFKSLEDLLRNAYREPDISLKAKVDDRKNATSKIAGSFGGHYQHTHEESPKAEFSFSLYDTGSVDREEKQGSPDVDRVPTTVGESIGAEGSKRVETRVSIRLADSGSVVDKKNESGMDSFGGGVIKRVGVIVGSIINTL
ncbi:uncharacterized protein LOC127864773 isoform X2 [Dreissena polymorpha]|uniref:uncharacterized protein LOC127864773 isoform X2 n=1 Tax=Dreissena polymorpha TaxID=45954 RepID=UPI002264B246|nr:uncharacterized protein LOC127864773 isoform X2 [Dreissena polymorpha]